MSAKLEVRSVSKSFDGKAVLASVSIQIHKGGIYSLIGPSGCGKTTLLRIIDGLEAPDSGQIFLDDQDVTAIPSEKRPVNLVFQRYALFPHLNVYKNVAFGLEVQGTPKPEIKVRVCEALERVKLSGFDDRKIDSLSGGQQQRVALARALIKRPRVVLLDEPFSALDPHLREEMRNEVRRLSAEMDLPFILVTHDQEEALSMSQELGVLLGGELKQWGTPQEVYLRPKSLEVAQFVGGLSNFELNDGLAYVRPERLTVHRRDLGKTWGYDVANQNSERRRMNATIEHWTFQGAQIKLFARSPSKNLVEVHLPASQMNRAAGELQSELTTGTLIELSASASDLMRW